MCARCGENQTFHYMLTQSQLKCARCGNVKMMPTMAMQFTQRRWRLLLFSCTMLSQRYVNNVDVLLPLLNQALGIPRAVFDIPLSELLEGKGAMPYGDETSCYM